MRDLISLIGVAVVLGGALKTLGAALTAISVGAVDVGPMGLMPLGMTMAFLPIGRLLR